MSAPTQLKRHWRERKENRTGGKQNIKLFTENYRKKL